MLISIFDPKSKPKRPRRTPRSVSATSQIHNMSTKSHNGSIQNPEIGLTHPQKSAPLASQATSSLQNHRKPSPICQKSRPEHQKLPLGIIKNHPQTLKTIPRPSETYQTIPKPTPEQLETIPRFSKICNHSPRGAGGRGRSP